MGLNWILPLLAFVGLGRFYYLGEQTLFVIFLIPTLLLLFFSFLISGMLKKGKKSAHELMARTVTFWWMLVLFLIGTSTHRSVSYLIIAMISFLACYEYFTFTRKPVSPRSDRVLELLIYLMIPLNLLIQYFDGEFRSELLILFSLVAVLPSALVLTDKVEGSSQQYAKYARAILFFVYALGTAGFLVNTDIKILLVCMFLTEIRDLISYWMGKFFSKSSSKWLNLKIAARVSPNKTWAVGILSTALLCLAVPFIPSDLFHYHGQLLGPTFFFIWALTIGVAGLFGDLIFSMLKRESAIKDSGQMMPGNSGVIDRIDSLIVTFAVTFFLLVTLN